ncbi:hypothetical protein MIND_00544700 [Mycena indigotica]|uniref:Uncharacterized protein n=1 Tax=Mycena indigotica TaxID=2126181 RepID=A0A8H6W7B3_9AGAR|nr:uncharacterized protein MIND_00544700 [Mycena indigotica]KAF7307502.1 hypothetical protein MIND_00544700 [Mycena indigotica]
MPPAVKQRRGWPPPLLAFLSAKTAGSSAMAMPVDEPPLVNVVALHRHRLPTPTDPAARRHVPPQYSPGRDGLWRRIDSYTLVGSTICDQTCKVTPTTIKETDTEFFNTIPSGWVRDTISTPARTSITVALSVSLAVFIFLTLIRCHFSLRKSHRRRRDLEKQKAIKRGDIHASTETLTPKPPTGPKSRKWMAKATERWRENARYLARQRRGRRTSRRGSTDSLSEPKLPTEPSTPRPASPSPSTTQTLSGPEEVEPSPEPTQAPALEPPAYLSPPQLKPSPAMDLRTILASDSPSIDTFPPYTPRPAPDESCDYFNPQPAVPPDNTAHLATDDKALLARLAERVSAPDMRAGSSRPTSSVPTQPTHVEPRAPPEDDLDYDFEGFEWSSTDPSFQPPPEQQAECSRSHSRPPSSPRLPSPPPAIDASSSFEKMQLERAYAAHDLDQNIDLGGPSMPLPSAPPPFNLEEGVVSVPSAPAFDEFDDDVYPEAGPSSPRAPPLQELEFEEDQLEYADEDELRNAATLQHDPDRHLQDPPLVTGKQEAELPEGENPRSLEHEAHDTGWDGG